MGRFSKAASGMTLAEHLAEARHRLMISIGSILLLGVAAFIFYPQILQVLQHPYCHALPRRCQFIATSPLDGLSLRVKIAFYGGLLFASPVCFWQAWRFVTPGLKARERRYAVPFVAASVLFFAGGCATAYFSFGHALAFLQSIGGHSLVAFYNPNQYLGLFMLMMFIFGVTFEFPVVLVALELARVVTPGQLLRAWRYALIAITIAAGVFTPSGDPLSMFALALPLTAFYFLSIGVGKLFGR
jgi:sec-independent protein translocase protein TatC